MDEPRRLELDEGCNESRSTEAFGGGCDVSIDNEPYTGVTSENEISKKSGICERCNCIPWKDLLKNPLWWVPDQPVIKEDKVPLKASSCRICNLFAKIIETQKLSENGPYHLRKYRPWYLKNKEVPGLPALNSSQTLRMFYLQVSDTDHITCPQLMVTDFQPNDTSTKLRYYQASNVDIEQVKAWITECETSHCVDCVGDAATHDPLRQLRVIDCDQKSTVPAPLGCRYVALSYVWGQHESAFNDLQNAPETIADSIDLTKRLGYKYLWVDRYCIDQTDRIDKHTQVLQMGEIYAAAQVTIVAAAGSDPSYGLPGVSSQSRPVPKSEKIGDLLPEDDECAAKEVMHSIHKVSKL
ncbi:uncharacterized protein ALTATR162_LOCUS9678 [Alternaria atra]|uniref:Heterokaryon incompatibility domain-containing protein n=1 Tax=Alternaria atra TaxID=119953 RepID=A0A8J2N934_9PLEO|nr:uncharacterized protein ALTATR162_LOCUS9678 [Alternaria atra]CAG5181270.1 unnamed protein product [Alternaria atra]